MREGRELIGWGMATGVWEAQLHKTSARATLTIDGKLEVALRRPTSARAPTPIMTQIAADALGLADGEGAFGLGDSTLPKSPVEGGSCTAATVGSAVDAACKKVREEAVRLRRKMTGSPLADATSSDVHFADGADPGRRDPTAIGCLVEAMRAGGVERIEARRRPSPSMLTQKKYSRYTHSAMFVEVRVDEDFGAIRVTRVVSAVAAGRILNPKTARSQIIGGVVWGIGMALHEETSSDHSLGRFMNHNLAEYHVPVNADVHDIEVIFVEEHDDDRQPARGEGPGRDRHRRRWRRRSPMRSSTRRASASATCRSPRQSVERLSAVAARDGEHALSAGELDGPDSS